MQLSEQGLVEVMDGGREADDDIRENTEDFAFNQCQVQNPDSSENHVS